MASACRNAVGPPSSVAAVRRGIPRYAPDSSYRVGLVAIRGVGSRRALPPAPLPVVVELQRIVVAQHALNQRAVGLITDVAGFVYACQRVLASDLH